MTYEEFKNQFDSNTSENAYGEVVHWIDFPDLTVAEITDDEQMNMYSILLYDQEGFPNRSYYNVNTLQEAYETIVSQEWRNEYEKIY